MPSIWSVSWKCLIDGLLKLNFHNPVKNSLHIIIKDKCESILTNFLFYLQVNHTVILRANSISSHPASVAKEVRVAPINNWSTATPFWPELTSMSNPERASFFLASFVGRISPFNQFHPLVSGILHCWDLRLVAYGRTSGSLQQVLLKSLPILLPALPGPNAQIRDCVQKAVLKSIIPSFKIDLSRWRRKSGKHFLCSYFGKVTWEHKGHSITVCWMNVWIERCLQNFTLRPHSQKTGLLPKTVSSYLIRCHFLVKITDCSIYFSTQPFHSFINHLLKVFLIQIRVKLECRVDIDKVLEHKIICWLVFLDLISLCKIVDLHPYSRQAFKISGVIQVTCQKPLPLMAE